MKVLVVGASGFIGNRIAAALLSAGHDVLRGGTNPTRKAGEVQLHFSHMATGHISQVLMGVDAVVNAAGILREEKDKRFSVIHESGPQALFAGCEAAGVRKVVQISALGADFGAASRFHRSKKRADDFLAGLALDWTIVQPSLVFGPEGASARQFAALASLPVIPLPGDGRQTVQPIHVEDLVDLVLRILEGPPQRARIVAVGPRPVTVREWLEELRRQMRQRATRTVEIPLAFVRLAIGSDALGMLLRGNTASPDQTRQLLGREPRDINDFVSPCEGENLSTRARIDWLVPLLRAAVALTWLGSGAVSLWLFPVEDSLAMLARVGLSGVLASAVLYGASIVDVLFGVGSYALRRGRRRWLWRAQLVLIAAYTAIVSVYLPEFWLHPFGPLLKNLPLMAAILLLHEFDSRERWTT
jgi:nucleoside-diphosphate-sugar epimerase